ncbi:MAG: threonine synthase [bacterium]|nr:threonine synthase [bacterium]MCP4965664.1 threonine synthase [bacterium]
MKNVTGLTCVICDKTYPADFAGYVCTDHGNEGILDVSYDYDAIAAEWTKEDLAANRDRTMWRYKPVMPVAPDAEVPQLTVGGTPMYDAAPLANDLGIAKVWVKDEGRQPTASLKDRASAMAVVKAREVGAEVVTTASTGNAAAALSGISASIGQKNVIFVPKSAPEAKIAQLLAYGSTVALVNGNYGDAFELCMLAAAEYGWYNRNTGYNPFMTEGKKTAGWEILEDLDWNIPDAIFVSVGDGSIIGGVHKAMKDAVALGWIEKSPRIYGIQAAGSDYMVQAFESGEDILTKAPIAADTVADSISADLPRDRIKAMRAVTETGGAYVRVSDDEILTALPLMARGSGVFAEPAGATAYAGLIKAVAEGLVTSSDEVVVLSTGSGLKDVASAMKAVTAAGTTPMVVDPNLEALKQALVKGTKQ